MSQIKISGEALAEVERAFVEYREEFADLEHDGAITTKVEEAHLRYAATFVQWLRGEFRAASLTS